MKRKYGILLLSNAWTGGRFCEVLRPFHLKKKYCKTYHSGPKDTRTSCLNNHSFSQTFTLYTIRVENILFTFALDRPGILSNRIM